MKIILIICILINLQFCIANHTRIANPDPVNSTDVEYPKTETQVQALTAKIEERDFNIEVFTYSTLNGEMESVEYYLKQASFRT